LSFQLFSWNWLVLSGMSSYFQFPCLKPGWFSSQRTFRYVYHYWHRCYICMCIYIYIYTTDFHIYIYMVGVTIYTHIRICNYTCIIRQVYYINNIYRCTHTCA
jgi:hypothetical protein